MTNRAKVLRPLGARDREQLEEMVRRVGERLPTTIGGTTFVRLELRDDTSRPEGCSVTAWTAEGEEVSLPAAVVLAGFE